MYSFCLRTVGKTGLYKWYIYNYSVVVAVCQDGSVTHFLTYYTKNLSDISLSKLVFAMFLYALFKLLRKLFLPLYTDPGVNKRVHKCFYYTIFLNIFTDFICDNPV